MEGSIFYEITATGDLYIKVQPGQTLSEISETLTGDPEAYRLLPKPKSGDYDLVRAGELIPVSNQFLKRMQDHLRGGAATQPVPSTQKTKPPTTAPATREAGGILADKMMLVTFYIDKGRGSSGRTVGPGSVAVSDTTWRRKPGIPGRKGEYRIKKGAAVPAYPYGSKVTVYDKKGNVIYTGVVVDTGRGWVRHGYPADAWVDVWFRTRKEGHAALKQREYRVVIEQP